MPAKGQNTTKPKKLGSVERKKNFALAIAIATPLYSPSKGCGMLNVDLLARTCTYGHFQYNDIPCGHAIAVIQT